jgi:hypothetical protein
MLYILNINKFIGLYNLEYFSTAMLVSLIFKNAFDKPRNEIRASELCRYYAD